MDPQPRLLYFVPYGHGGLLDYAHEQATALQAEAVEVRALITPQAARAKLTASYGQYPVLRDAPHKAECPSKLARRMQAVRALLVNARVLSHYLREERFGHCLFCAFYEYLAPLWAGQLRRLANRGVRFGSVVHDPARNFVVGPRLWHEWSTASGYSFLQEAFVHEPVELRGRPGQRRLHTTVIPHGPYAFPAATESREALRRKWDIPEDGKLLLAFGHLRDAKNLDLVLEAMKQQPEFYLLVAGRELGVAQRPATFYRRRAVELGIAKRCRWEIRHIEDKEVGECFCAADLILLTYSAVFRSASGVLNVAAHFRKPCLASSGPSNLRSVVEKYGLGLWIQPDSSAAIADGLRQWLQTPAKPDWETYLEDHSWKRNAQLVAQRMFTGSVEPKAGVIAVV